MTAIPNIVTIVGNLTEDPEVKSLQDGTKVTNFSIASTDSRFDKETNSYKDGETVFYRASAWRRDAENIGASLKKGNRVIAVAKVKPNPYTTKGGDAVTTFEFEIQEIGASLAFATVTVTGNPKGQGGNAAPTRSDAVAAAPTTAATPAAAAAPTVVAASDEDFS